MNWQTIICVTFLATKNIADGGPSCDDCKLPKVPGICSGLIPRFWFNTKTGVCEEFVYGGCGGNNNNFKTIEKCCRRCSCLKSAEERLMIAIYGGVASYCAYAIKNAKAPWQIVLERLMKQIKIPIYG